jgi:PAS domain S-box-containing protein
MKKRASRPRKHRPASAGRNGRERVQGKRPVPLAEVALPDREAQSALLELSRTLFVGLDHDGIIRSCYGAWDDSLHVPPENLLGRPLLELVDPRDFAACRTELQRTLAGHPPSEFTARFRGNSRGTVWLSLRPRVNASRDGLHVVARDITAEKLAADTLPPVHQVLDEIEEGVLVIDATRSDLPVLYANEGFSRLTGYPATESCNRSVDFLTGPETDTKSFSCAIAAARHGERSSSEICIRHRNGSPIWVRFTLRPVIGANGTVQRVIALHGDVSERRLVVDALRAKNEALTEALESLQHTKEAIVQRERMHALGKMASGIVHDFNNLLAPILGFTELLLTVPDLLQDGDRVSTYLQKIRTAATDGAAVVSRLREFYRTRHDDEEPTEFSVQLAVQETLELTRHRWQHEAQANGAQINVERDLKSTPPVHGSAAEIRQALMNILLNAMDAMPAGGTLRVRTYPVGNWACIEIADNGVGMPEEVRRRCFEPFFTTKGRSGTGLGLSIVFGTIERHQGRVELHSEPGSGTKFTLWLPAGTGSVTSIEGPAPAPDPDAGRALRVLVVDDEDLLLEVVSQHLLNMGHSVDCFTDPRAALESFYKAPHDLVITDRAMPVMSGDQFAKLVREFNAETPIVLLSGFGSIIKQSGESPANIDEVLAKPVSRQTLCEMVARYGGRSIVGPSEHRAAAAQLA